MYSFTKLIAACRIVRNVHASVRISVLCHFLDTPRASLTNTIMAQRSITSFFKVSPPKCEVKQEKPVVKQEADEKEDEEVKDISPVSNGKAQVSS